MKNHPDIERRNQKLRTHLHRRANDDRRTTKFTMAQTRFTDVRESIAWLRGVETMCRHGTTDVCSTTRDGRAERGVGGKCRNHEMSATIARAQTEEN